MAGKLGGGLDQRRGAGSSGDGGGEGGLDGGGEGERERMVAGRERTYREGRPAIGEGGLSSEIEEGEKWDDRGGDRGGRNQQVYFQLGQNIKGFFLIKKYLAMKYIHC